MLSVLQRPMYSHILLSLVAVCIKVMKDFCRCSRSLSSFILSSSSLAGSRFDSGDSRSTTPFASSTGSPYFDFFLGTAFSGSRPTHR